MSHVSNHVHIVFSTTNRLKLIPQELQPKLWAYMAGIATHHGMHAVAIGGIEDHVHVLLNLSRSQVATVRRYIANQREHHRKMDSAQEFELLLERHGFTR